MSSIPTALGNNPSRYKRPRPELRISLANMYLELFVGSAILFGAYVYYQFYLHPLSNYPGPPLAKITDFWHAYVCSTMKRNEYIARAHDKYGPIIRIGPNMLYIATASSIDEIYTNRKFLKADRYKTLESHDNIFCVTNPKEYARRNRLVAPAFSQKSTDALEVELTRPLVQKWIQRLKERLGNKDHAVINFTDWIDFVITEVVGKVSFGMEFGYLDKLEKHPGLHLVSDTARTMAIVSCMPSLKWFLPLMISWRKLYRTVKYMDNIGEYIKTCNSKIEQGEKAAKTSICAMIKQTGAETDDALTLSELVDECTVFVIAGADTTATVINNCFFYLAKHPEIQDKVVKELHEHYDSLDDVLTADIAKLPYLHAVLRESMRIWPAVTGHQERINREEDSIISGYHIPKGTEIASSLMYIVHDPANFHDPWTFKPERWIDPACTDNLASSKPFSVGSRICIGQKQAWQEMRLIIPHLLWNFKLEPHDKVLLNYDISITYRGPNRIKVSRRAPKVLT